MREIDRCKKMDGDWVVRKPGRSDEVLEAEQQVQVANQIRAYFESTAPKRPKKPSRSEGLPQPLDDAAATDGDDDPIAAPEIIPEYNRFRELQSQSHTISAEEPADFAHEEFVETKYYCELNSIDKQHHTTGNGFIRATETRGDQFTIHFQEHESVVGEANGARRMMNFTSNPATNEWIPRVEEEAIFSSNKPSRSES